MRLHRLSDSPSAPCLALAEFVTPGLEVPAMIPGDQLMRMSLSSEVAIAGLPLELLVPPARLPADIRKFVAASPWTFASTYADTWPHEYVVRTPQNAELLGKLAHHIFTYGVKGRFYDSAYRYFHEGGKAYWSMDATPESTVQGPPALVVEISSPSTRRLDLRLKRELYARTGVSEYWIVDPDQNAVAVHRRDDTGALGLAQVFADGERLLTPLLPGLDVPLGELFA